jgi:hypothetical protein
MSCEKNVLSSATVTATCIFFEVIGPILTRIALKKAGEIPEALPKAPSQ